MWFSSRRSRKEKMGVTFFVLELLGLGALSVLVLI